MNMQPKNISPRQLKIVQSLREIGVPSSYSTIASAVSPTIAERTLKRELADLVEQGVLSVHGAGRATTYELNKLGLLFLAIDADQYVAQEPDTRAGVQEQYQFNLWRSWPSQLFSSDEVIALKQATKEYTQRSLDQSEDVRKRELERFVIEMSWKSSKIEGNTYTLLDTELLLKEGVASKHNTEEETQMILNHKEAFDFVRQHEDACKEGLSFATVDTLHQHLTKGLVRHQGIRAGMVGITGSRYRPLDNAHQLREALDTLVHTLRSIPDPFSQALTALVGLSYIQPFADGNKRTARLLANGILLAHGCAPLSYRDVDERQYRASLLVFYEQLSIAPMKQLFVDQYFFSCEQYSSV